MRKTVFVTDPGIDGAFAIALAMLDPTVDVLGLAATAGNVSAEQATRNVHILIEQVDPPRWPRVGAALPVSYDIDGVNLHGPGGLGGVEFPCAQLHHPHPSDKLISDLVRQAPGEVSVVLMGPATGFARALDRDGTTLVVRRADRLEVLATNRLDDAIDASPVLVGRQLLLRGHGHLYCIEEK